MKISLIVPVYNETRRLEKGLNLALNYLQHQPFSWELIIVNDGSSDNTKRLIAHLLQPLSHLPIYALSLSQNRGKGHAIRIGVAAAEGDYIIFSDIDFSVSIDHVPQFLTALKNQDIAIGSRRLATSHISKHQSAIRESLGRGFTALSNLILGLHHSDLTCGFKAFRQSCAKQLFSVQNINEWAYDSEILFLAKEKKLRITEIPVNWRNDPLTKVNVLTGALSSLIALFRIRLAHELVNKYPA